MRISDWSSDVLFRSNGVAPAAATPFDTRAAQLVDLMTGKLAFADYFAPAFQHAVPEAQFKTITANLVAQYGQPVAVESASSTDGRQGTVKLRSEEHTSELQSLMRISYAVFCLKKKK